MAKGRKTGGRVAGTPNKATADIKAIAQEYTPEAMKALKQIIQTGSPDTARVAAISLLFDRGYGKAAQSVSVGGDAANPMRIAFRWDDDD
jgi:acylphosphatase